MVITIIDYGVGNLGSIENMVKKIGHKTVITKIQENILKADKIILPGVGAFDNGINKLHDYELIDVLNEVKKSGKYILGICLGMQLMANGSEEGVLNGLGWVDADVRGFSFDDRKLKIPHMGWNIIKPMKDSPVFNGFNEEIRAYFVHSYFTVCTNDNDVLATTMYGANFTSAFSHENIFGMQFHPEKSHRFGMQLLQNFIKM